MTQEEALQKSAEWIEKAESASSAAGSFYEKCMQISSQYMTLAHTIASLK